jgi:GNAT superfamily N-acetyltransferase
MHTSVTADSLLDMLEVRALSVDDLSTARYVVGAAFARGAAEHYARPQIEAFAEFVRSPHYGDVLLGNRAYGAFIGAEMVGVAAWSIGEGRAPTARILAVFVHPLFGGDGIGSRLVEYLEDEARAAGYSAVEASVTLNAAALFERLGYLETRRGAWGLPSGREIPIAFMRKTGGRRADSVH